VSAVIGEASALQPQPSEVVLAADIFYEGGSHERLLQAWAQAGAMILLADASRGLLPAGVGIPLAELDASTEPDIEVNGKVSVLQVQALAPQAG
jgi:predicted nicotinamide N-methyase